MRREYVFICSLTCLPFFLFSGRLLASGESGRDYLKGCAYLRCDNGSQCVKRRFWCKNPPCPGMLYCAKSRKEVLKGPLTCDTVRCNEGHMCVVRVRGCRWDGKCKQQLARCVPEKEYYEGEVSCAGFECPSGERCILRERNCVNPPCKLVRSCASAEDVQTWFEACKSLNCLSEYECFLRKPENNCLDTCMHTPDCTFTNEDELISKYCYGWICPRAQKCVVRIIDSCKGSNCIIERSCRVSSVSTRLNTNAELRLQSSTVTSAWKENIRHTTPIKHGPEVSLAHQQIAITKSNLITESSESSTNEPDLTLSSLGPPNYDKFSTIDESEVFQSPTVPLATTLPANAKTEPTMSRDKQILEMGKIYITTDDTLPLPMMLEDINFFEQGYPIWIKNDPYHSLQVKDEKWRYYAPQEPYKILLPPYEPVILVEDTRRRGEQFLSVFTDTLDLIDEVLISLSEITSTDIGDSKTSTWRIADDKPDNYTNGSTVVETETVRANHSDDLSDDHESSPATEKTSTTPPSIRDKEPSDYDNYAWYIIHDFPEWDEPRSSHEQRSKSSTVHLATDDFNRNDTLVAKETSTRGQITDEESSRVPETRHVDGRNKNLTTLSPSASTGQSNYSTRDEKLYGLANYPRDTIPVHQVGKSSRAHGGSSPKQIFAVSSNEEGNQRRDTPITFPLGQLLGGRANVP